MCGMGFEDIRAGVTHVRADEGEHCTCTCMPSLYPAESWSATPGSYYTILVSVHESGSTLQSVRRPADIHLTQAMPNHFSRQFSPETRDSCQASAATDALYPPPYCCRRGPSDGRASRPARPWRPAPRHLAYLGAGNRARDNGILATARQLRQRRRR